MSNKAIIGEFAVLCHDCNSSNQVLLMRLIILIIAIRPNLIFYIAISLAFHIVFSYLRLGLIDLSQVNYKNVEQKRHKLTLYHYIDLRSCLYATV